MSDFTRVRDKKTGHTYSIATGAVDKDQHQVLEDADAVDANGKPLPPEYAETKTTARTAGKEASS